MEEEFINSAEVKINDIINDLGWSIDYFQTMKPVLMVTCPNNSAHRLPRETLDTHLETCNWTSAGYKKYELPLSVNSSCNSYVQLTCDLQEKIISEAALLDETFQMEIAGARSTPREVPMSSSRLTQNFTRDERRAIYDYVISNTESSVKILVPDAVSLPKSEEKRELTAVEILAAERDAKRRRATYRNKVHTNRKTHVEIMREVIDSQMNCLLDEPNESSSSKQQQNKMVETSRNESDSRKDRRRESSHKTHHSSRSDRRDKNKESTGHNSSRSSHRSRSDSRYNDDRSHHRTSEKEYSDRCSYKRKREDNDKWSDEIRSRRDTKESDFDIKMGHDNRRRDPSTLDVPNKGVGIAELKLSLDEYLKDVIKKEKKHKKDKHKKHKKKKKKHKKKHSSTSSSESD